MDILDATLFNRMEKALALAVTFIVEKIQKSRVANMKTTALTKKILTISIHTDFYGHDTKWFLQDSNDLELIGSPYGPNRKYSFDTCIVDMCHTFTITDAGGDGMCCSFGDGSYQV